MSAEYRRGLVKTANERLRKIETKYHLTEDSIAYKKIANFALSEPNGKGKFFSVSDDMDKIRFLNKTEFMKLTEEQRIEYNEMLDKFLGAKTSTKIGIEQSFQNALDTFNKDNEHGFQFDNVDQYKEFWKTYQNVTEGRIDDKLYNSLSLDIFFNNFDIKKLLETETLEDVLRTKLGTPNKKWSDILTKKSNIRKNVAVPVRPKIIKPTMASRAPRKPNTPTLSNNPKTRSNRRRR